MATHSSILAWRIPWMADPGGLWSMGSHRVRHDWDDWAAASREPQKSVARTDWIFIKMFVSCDCLKYEFCTLGISEFGIVISYSEISPGCSLEGLMLKLKLQYFGHLMRRADSMEKTLMLGGIGGRRRRGRQRWDGWMASLIRWAWVWVNSGSWWWTGRPGVLRFMGSQRVRHDWATELNW